LEAGDDGVVGFFVVGFGVVVGGVVGAGDPAAGEADDEGVGGAGGVGAVGAVGGSGGGGLEAVGVLASGGGAVGAGGGRAEGHALAWDHGCPLWVTGSGRGPVVSESTLMGAGRKQAL
jgi:hypothetical protein